MAAFTAVSLPLALTAPTATYAVVSWAPVVNTAVSWPRAPKVKIWDGSSWVTVTAS